jgi:hypothetical protein
MLCLQRHGAGDDACPGSGQSGGFQALETLRDWLSAGQHLPVRIQQLLTGLLA